MSAAKVKIIRYVKIRSTVNPYDPKWELYLEARLGWQLTQTRTGYESGWNISGRDKRDDVWSAVNRCEYYVGTQVAH